MVSTMTREMTFEELKAELEKLASLKTMEDAIGGKPKVTKMVQEQQQQERRSRPGWPAGLDPAQFGCLKCGSKDGHNARSCQVDRKDLACNFCGRQQSHVEAVCFKKLESEGKLAPRQQQQQQPQQQQQQTAARHPSPAGGPRSQTPGPQKLNALKLRRQSKRPLASLGGKSSEVKETREGGRLQQQQSTDEAEEQHKQEEYAAPQGCRRVVGEATPVHYPAQEGGRWFTQEAGVRVEEEKKRSRGGSQSGG